MTTVDLRLTLGAVLDLFTVEVAALVLSLLLCLHDMLLSSIARCAADQLKAPCTIKVPM
jgi:hypothetical protein